MNKYFCEKCNKYHYRGKIYREHFDYESEKAKENSYTNDEEIRINFKNFRPIAKRQLDRLFRKANKSGNHELYKKEIMKLIKNEKRR